MQTHFFTDFGHHLFRLKFSHPTEVKKKRTRAMKGLLIYEKSDWTDTKCDHTISCISIWCRNQVCHLKTCKIAQMKERWMFLPQMFLFSSNSIDFVRKCSHFCQFFNVCYSLFCLFMYQSPKLNANNIHFKMSIIEFLWHFLLTVISGFGKAYALLLSLAEKSVEHIQSIHTFVNIFNSLSPASKLCLPATCNCVFLFQFCL